MTDRAVLVALAALASAAAVGCGGASYAVTGTAAPRVPIAPPGVYVDDDVAQGYGDYEAALAPYGRWSSDATYGAHWCPARANDEAPAFRPYVSNGHWTTSTAPAYGAAPGTPYWEADGSAPWMELTTHHGWWIDVSGGSGAWSQWCWVPGERETPARVVWRTDDEFVGWAPEPPVWVDDGDECAAAMFAWTFELLGTLLEGAVDGYVLPPEQAEVAAEATSPARRPSAGGATFGRRAPAQPSVAAARRELVAYVAAHPSAASASTSSSGSSGSSSPGSSSSKKDKDDVPVRVFVGVDHLPPGPMIVTLMMTDPPVGAGGATRFGGGVASAGGRVSTSGTSEGGGATVTTALRSHGGGWTAHAASSPGASRGYGGGSTSHASYTPSSSSHGSSGGGSGGGSSGGGSHASPSSGSSHHGHK